MGDWKSLLILVLCVQLSGGSNILAVVPVFIKSHSIFTHIIIKELAIRGHNVTILTSFPDPNPPENYRQVLADQESCWEPEVTDEQREEFLSGNTPFLLTHLERWDSMLWFTEIALNSSKIRQFMAEDNTKYDLIIGELFYQEAFLMVTHKYKAPIVLLSSLDGHSVSQATGSPTVASAIPFEFGKTAEIKNTWERAVNVFNTVFDWIGRRYYVLPRQQALAEKYFGHLTRPLPRLEDIEKNVSLTLVNTHFTIDSMRPTVPGVVDVAGVHIKPAKELPDDMKKFVEDAEDGVIYFSLGTIISSSKFPPKRVQAFFDAFSQLKQRVIWKWDTEPRTNVSQNIMLAKWVPQGDLLAHPKTKLFITHGGFLGLTEAVHFGVPILGIPIFGDQFVNVEKAVKMGFGQKMLFKDITAENILKNVKQIVNNPKYFEQAKKVSKLFKDKPMSPMDTAIFWIEYVLRNDGAVHLRSPLFGLNTYEILLLDVASLVVLCICAIGIASYYLLKFFKGKCGRGASNKIKKE